MSEKQKAQTRYRLTYAIDGQPCYAEMVEKGARLVNHPKPEKQYHTFSGWGEVPARMPAHDLTLDGHFTPVRYRALFASGVVQYAIKEQCAMTPLTPPEDPVREGYAFRGWRNFTGVMPGENTTYEAIFEPCAYRLTYLVDGTFRFTFTVPYGEVPPRLEEPRKKNHVFSGWSDIPAAMPAEDVLVTGSFTEKLYKLTRMVDGEVFCEEMLPCGAAVDKKLKPIREGYYFSGWRKLPETMPPKDVTVAASMYPARYRADFYINGELFHSRYIPFGERVTAPLPPEEHGMLFGGWNNLPETMPARDIRVEGTRNAKLYSLSFVADGTEIMRAELAEGAPIPKEVEVPSKEGFAFCGWDQTPQAMPASDLTLHAVYATVRSHYVFYIDGEKYEELDPGEDGQITMPMPPSYDGHRFSGWNAMKLDPLTGVTTFEGSYEDAPRYTLTFLIRGETYETRKLVAGEAIVPPTVESGEEFEFYGWGECPAVMPPYDLTVEALVRTLRHRLNFVIDGEVAYTMSLDTGDEISCPAVAQRKGFTFGGWQDVPAVMPARDLTVYASYIRNQHTATYVVGGEILLTGSVGCGEPLVPPEVPQMKEEKYSFVGWIPETAVMPDEDLVITGVYSDTHCLLEIYVDGMLYEKKIVKVGEPIDLPEIEVGEGEHFEWQDVPPRAPEGNLEVHGGRVANLYQVTYCAGDTVLGTEEYRFGETVRCRVAAPSDGNGVFLGWQGLEQTMPAHDLTVQAHFESRTFRVTFVLDDSVLQESEVAVGARIPTPEVPVREGYSFDGWRNFVEIMPAYNFTAYGSYSRRKYTLTYICGGNTLASTEYSFGDPITPIAAPAREGETFDGWEGLTDTMPAHDLTVSAHYGGREFRISYLVDGELLCADRVEMGSRIVPKTAPEREGLVFAGWDNLPEFMPDHEVIATARYEHRTYAVTYKVNEIIWRIDRYDAGDTVTPPTPPEHPHETFVRWRNFSSVMPEYDFTCVAEYSEAFGRYTFILDGEVVSTGKCRKGEMITPPAAPHRSGFAFAGWNGFTGYMPAGDVTYIGNYVSDTFKVRYMLDGELYREDGYNEKEKVVPVEAPEREGYTFSGWRGVPKKMPADDVTVTGQMIPRSFRLIYRTDETVHFDDMVPCGTKLGKVTAPEIHGMTFNGWIDEPQTMPPHDVTVVGMYAHSEPLYKTVVPGREEAKGDVSVRKGPASAPSALAVVSGSYLRLIIDNICYPVIGAADCIRNSRVTDQEKLCASLHRTYRKFALPHKKIKVLFNDSALCDAAFETPHAPTADLVRTAQTLFGEEPEKKQVYHSYVMSEGGNGTDRVWVSALDEERNEAFVAAFRRCGVTVTDCCTLMGALAEYLQFNRRMERGKNQMCLFYLPTTVLGALLLDGQVVYMNQNRMPYRDRSFDVASETERLVRAMCAYAAQKNATEPLGLVTVGGIDRTHVRDAEKLMPHLLRRLAGEENTGLFTAKRYRRPSMETLGFAATENRTK